ncbi:MAG TPA: hypothetical protein PK771_01165 [Spirochaetota bacterium]|nr:hypothetical protein [Spirochaetota bacterium]
MKESIFYILTINLKEEYDRKFFKKKINLAIDWIKIMPNVFIIESVSDKDKWLNRLKQSLNENEFFLAEIDINNNTGYLPKWIWEWINTKKESK